MDLTDRFTIDAPIDAVWEQLRDARALAACFPGAELLEQVDDTTYKGQVSVRFGPTTVAFKGQATIVTDDASRTGTIDARGRDGRGSTTAAARADVTVTGDAGGTVVALGGTIDVTGPLSSFASTGGVHVAKALFQDFAVNVGARARATANVPTLGRVDRDAPGADAFASAPPPSFTKVAWRSLRSFVRGLFRRGER